MSASRGRPATRGEVATKRIEAKVTPEEFERYTGALRDDETLAGVIRTHLDRWAARRGVRA